MRYELPIRVSRNHLHQYILLGTRCARAYRINLHYVQSSDKFTLFCAVFSLTVAGRLIRTHFNTARICANESLQQMKQQTKPPNKSYKITFLVQCENTVLLPHLPTLCFCLPLQQEGHCEEQETL